MTTRRQTRSSGAGEPQSLGTVVGENLRRVRRKWQLTQDEAAARLRAVGLPWTRSHVAAIEAGNRETVDAGTLILLAAALRVSPRDLLEGRGSVQIEDARFVRGMLADVFTEDAPHLPAAVRGPHGFETLWGPANLDLRLDSPVTMAVTRALRHHDANAVDRAARRLWGHSADEERDRRVAEIGELTPRQRQAHRGHVTRQLTKEIAEYLARTRPAARQVGRRRR